MNGHSNNFGHLQSAALTDIGRKRKNNEDSYGAFPAYGVWCVADGMGGGDDGEVASAAVVKSVDAYLSDLPPAVDGAYSANAIATGVISAIEEASGWIFRRTKKKNLKGCGSTFVGIVFDPTSPGTALALHVGDSRLYRLRGKDFKQITKDHSVAEMMGAKDESQLNPMFRGMILRAVGIEGIVEVEQTPLAVAEGDVILVCSDGLSRMLPDKRIAEIIRDESDNLERAVKRLIAEANEAGGVDNITVELIRVGALPAAVHAATLAQGDESRISVSTLHTLDREYSQKRRWPVRRLAIAAAVAAAVLAFGWAVSRPFLRDDTRKQNVPVVEAMPKTVSNPVAATEKSPEPAAAAVVTNETTAAEQPETPKQPPAETVAATTNAVIAIEEPACTTNDQAAATQADRERDAVAEELRAERQRREQEELAAIRQEQERREAALGLAETYERDFVEFARFIDGTFGKGASDRAYSLCRNLHARRKDVDACVCATDFTAEIGVLAQKLAAKCEATGKAQGAALVAKCKEFASQDPAAAATQRKCLELIKYIADSRKRNNGRK